MHTQLITSEENTALRPVPEIYRPSFRENKENRSFSISENERFGLVFAKTEPINTGTGRDHEVGNSAK
jgi:hypothetical protein